MDKNWSILSMVWMYIWRMRTECVSYKMRNIIRSKLKRLRKLNKSEKYQNLLRQRWKLKIKSKFDKENQPELPSKNVETIEPPNLPTQDPQVSLSGRLQNIIWTYSIAFLKTLWVYYIYLALYILLFKIL